MACDCLNNEDELASVLADDSHIDSDLGYESEIVSDVGSVVEVWHPYQGVATDDIIVSVDNDKYEISATLQRTWYNSVDEFPVVGSENIIYGEQDTHTLYVWDTETSTYKIIIDENATRGQLDALEERLQNAESKLDTAEDDITSLKDGLNRIDIELESAEHRLDSAEDSIISLQQDINQINDKISDLATKEELSNLDRELQSAEHRLDSTEDSIIELQKNIDNVDKSTDTLFADVEINDTTGEFTFTRKDGTKLIIDTLLEKVVTNFDYNEQTQSIELTLEDGTVKSIPMSAFIDVYTGVDGDIITISISRDNEISATIKNGTITLDKLTQTLQDYINGKADKSELSNYAKNDSVEQLQTEINALQDIVDSNTDDITELSERVTAVENRVVEIAPASRTRLGTLRMWIEGDSLCFSNQPFIAFTNSIVSSGVLSINGSVDAVKENTVLRIS